MKTYGKIALLLLLVLLSCQATKGKVVATVGDRKILAGDLEEEYLKWAKEGRIEKKDEESVKSLLETMINRDLLFLAATKDMPDTTRLARIVKRFEEDLLRKTLLDRETVDRIKVTNRDAKNLYKKQGEEIRIRHILVASLRQAEDVIKLLKEGGQFEVVAQKFSLDQRSGASGGDMGYYTWGEFPPELEKVAFGLGNLEISKPVKSTDGYHILRVDERRKRVQNPFKEEEKRLTDAVRTMKGKRLTEEFYLKLEKKYELSFNEKALELLAGKFQAYGRSHIPTEGEILITDTDIAGTLKISPSELSLSLAKWKGGETSVTDFLNYVQNFVKGTWPKGGSPIEVETFALKSIRDSMVLAEAYSEGLQRNHDIEEKIRLRREEGLVTRYFYGRISGKSVPSEEEMRNFYKEHLDSYSEPEKINVAYALLDSLGAAKGFADKLRSGENFANVVAEYSTKYPAFQNEPSTGFFGRGESKSKELEDVAFNLSLNEVAGPVPIEKKYLVVKVIEKKEKRPLPWEEAREYVRRDLSTLMDDQALKDHLEGLKKEYGVKVDEGVLKQVVKKVLLGKVENRTI
ncbi:MAG: peptidyl-prolyl cis-trans isomerase [Candidatus Eisenbacteria bacterium]|nr:peptidyl-prolyl cis-trans isomerase [Candidatus Eisenbacteria bacterium]